LKFADYSNGFFLILILIVGIWVIQPMIKQDN